MEFWKNGLLPFDPAKNSTNYFVRGDGTEHPDFERVMLRKSVKYHHNCHIRYSPYNLARKKKSLRSKNKNVEMGQSSVFYIYLWAQILVHLQIQQFQILFALYAVNMMPLRTLMPLGHLMRLNQDWIVKVNMLWSWQVIGEIKLFILVITHPTFQRRINVVSTLWSNVEITLIRRWKWNKIWRRI